MCRGSMQACFQPMTERRAREVLKGNITKARRHWSEYKQICREDAVPCQHDIVRAVYDPHFAQSDFAEECLGIKSGTKEYNDVCEAHLVLTYSADKSLDREYDRYMAKVKKLEGDVR